MPTFFLWKPNARGEPRLKAGTQRSLEGVGCSAWFGGVRPVLYSSSTFHDLIWLLCIPLSDHLIRLEEDMWGNRQPERLGSLEVDDQLELHRLLHRQVGGLGAFEDLVHIGGGAAEHVRATHPIVE